MATITKRNNGWRVQIRKQGISRSAQFRTKAEAQAWAIEVESKIIHGDYNNIPNITFAELIDKYLKEVSIHKRGYRSEKLRLLRLSNMPIGKILLPDLQEQDFKQWRDERLAKVSHATVLREWGTLSHIINTAIDEWKYLKSNPLKTLKKPPTPKERTRRYSDQEIERLTFVAGYDFKYAPLTAQSRTAAAMLFAIETAMRAGEICNAKWTDLNMEKRLLHIPTSKNGHPRDIPLSLQAIKIINHLALIRTIDDEFIFKLNTKVLDATFRVLKERAGFDDADLHFHDTRREALSRISKKVDVMTLAKISGHRDIKILLNTYYAPNMEEFASLLDK